MAIDGLIILDNTGYVPGLLPTGGNLMAIIPSRHAIIQSGFRSASSAYPILHIDALNNALEKAARPSDVDPVLYVSSLELDTPSACCHVKHGDLRFLCPVSGDCMSEHHFLSLPAVLTCYSGSPLCLRVPPSIRGHPARVLRANISGDLEG